MSQVSDANSSRAAFHELLDLLKQVDSQYLAPENHIVTPEQVAAGHRFLMHALGTGLDMFFDADAAQPQFRRTLWSGRKAFGDSPDTIYYYAVIDPARSYRIRGNIFGAVYTSFSVEGGSIDERFPPTRIVAALNDTEFDIDADGNYEIIASAQQPQTEGQAQPRNWLRLETDAGAIATRHYFERATSIADDPQLHIPLQIELLDGAATAYVPTPASVARDLRRLKHFVRGLTLDMAANTGPKPPFMSTVPNQFNPPAGLQAGRYGATDIVNMMVPYALQPDQALIIEGGLPPCRFANFMLWNRFLQTYDYVNYSVALNRQQLTLQADGRFRIVIAHRDPGVPNWLDTTGANFGLIYVRYILPDEQPTELLTRVVPLAELHPS